MRISRSSVTPMSADHQEQQDEWQEHCLSSVREMTAVIEAVVLDLADLGYSAKDIFAARLALEEAICNAIKHGHRADPTKVAKVRYRIHTDHLLAEVQDQGPGFNAAPVRDATAPENVERPGGRGLLLMGHYAAWVRYNPEGNCVTFCICHSNPIQCPPQVRLPLCRGVNLA